MDLHVLERNPLGRLGNGKNLARILGGKEPHRYFCEKETRYNGQDNRDCQSGAAVAQDLLQGTLIAIAHTVEEALHEQVKAAMPVQRPEGEGTCCRAWG